MESDNEQKSKIAVGWSGNEGRRSAVDVALFSKGGHLLQASARLQNGVLS
jgi:hypothetical protein